MFESSGDYEKKNEIDINFFQNLIDLQNLIIQI